METETVEIVDVVDVESLPSNLRQIESIQPKWIKPAEILHRCRMQKTALQQAITKLTDKYKVPLSLLRRGAARNTEYSAFAVELIKALKSGDDLKICEVLSSTATATPVEASCALVIAEKNIQVAQQRGLMAGEHFKSAKVNLGSVMADLRELGRSQGRKAVNEFKVGFAEEVDAGLGDLGVQIETVFDVEE